jgi:protein SCO1/2
MRTLIRRIRARAARCCAIGLALLGLQCAAGAAQFDRAYWPRATFTTHEGRRVDFYDHLVRGRAVAVNVIYTLCQDECPLETARMAETQRLLGARAGRDVLFISISIDPEHDTPAVLAAYARRFDVGPGWVFLTGAKRDIVELTRKIGLSRRSDAISKDGHASSLMLGNDVDGQWMRTSAVENPPFLVATMGGFFGWKDMGPTVGYEQARALTIDRAQATFESRCASCHTIGGGDRIGPDLARVGERRDPAWLRRYLKEPDRVRAEGDPVALGLTARYAQVRMPNLRLGDEDVDALVRHIDRVGRAQPTAATPAHVHRH